MAPGETVYVAKSLDPEGYPDMTAEEGDVFCVFGCLKKAEIWAVRIWLQKLGVGQR